MQCVHETAGACANQMRTCLKELSGDLFDLGPVLVHVSLCERPIVMFRLKCFVCKAIAPQITGGDLLGLILSPERGG